MSVLAARHATEHDPSGVMYSPVERLTTQEYDLQFGTNVLGT